MTLFEYLTVAISIVVGLAAARLLDALPHILKKGRRYWVHATISACCLANLGSGWWIFWSLHTVTGWTSAKFFLILLIFGLHYSIAGLLASSEAPSVESWRAYYAEIRVRLFSLGVVWIALISLQNWILLDIPWLHPSRLGELVGVTILGVGALSADSRVQAGIAILMAAIMLLMVLGLFFPSAPLLEGTA